MKIRDFLILALVLLMSGSVVFASAQKPVTVAVYNFSGTTDATELARKTTALITAGLSAEADLALVERAEIQKAIGEQSLGASGMVGSDAAVRLGQITGAKILVTGQVLLFPNDELIVVVNIIGTDSGHLLAVKIRGKKDQLVDLAAQAAQQTAQKIRASADLITPDPISHEAWVDQIVKSAAGTNRPAVLVLFHFPRSVKQRCPPVETEIGILLQRAGFMLVDEKSDRKPDVVVSGVVTMGHGVRHGDLVSCTADLDVFVQHRLDGRIVAYDRETAQVVDINNQNGQRAAGTKAADQLGVKILPLLSK